MNAPSTAPVSTTAPTSRSSSTRSTTSASSATIRAVMKLRGGLLIRTVSTRPAWSIWSVVISPPRLRGSEGYAYPVGRWHRGESAPMRPIAKEVTTRIVPGASARSPVHSPDRYTQPRPASIFQ